MELVCASLPPSSNPLVRGFGIGTGTHSEVPHPRFAQLFIGKSIRYSDARREVAWKYGNLYWRHTLEKYLNVFQTKRAGRVIFFKSLLLLHDDFCQF